MPYKESMGALYHKINDLAGDVHDTRGFLPGKCGDDGMDLESFRYGNIL